MKRPTKESAADRKEAALEKQAKKHHRYSGHNSVDFWRRVNALPYEERGAVYYGGVLLQNMEEDVLRLLRSLEVAEACRYIRKTGKFPPVKR